MNHEEESDFRNYKQNGRSEKGEKKDYVYKKSWKVGALRRGKGLNKE